MLQCERTPHSVHKKKHNCLKKGKEYIQKLADRILSAHSTETNNNIAKKRVMQAEIEHKNANVRKFVCILHLLGISDRLLLYATHSQYYPRIRWIVEECILEL